MGLARPRQWLPEVVWLQRQREATEAAQRAIEAAQRAYEPFILTMDGFPKSRSTYADREEAEKRARKLLLSKLTEEQQAMLKSRGDFEVVARSKNRYRIVDTARYNMHRGFGSVKRLRREYKTFFGFLRVIKGRRYCITFVAYGIPKSDWMLTVKLLLEADEAKFNRIANSHEDY